MVRLSNHHPKGATAHEPNPSPASTAAITHSNSPKPTSAKWVASAWHFQRTDVVQYALGGSRKPRQGGAYRQKRKLNRPLTTGAKPYSTPYGYGATAQIDMDTWMEIVNSLRVRGNPRAIRRRRCCGSQLPTGTGQPGHGRRRCLRWPSTPYGYGATRTVVRPTSLPSVNSLRVRGNPISEMKGQG